MKKLIFILPAMLFCLGTALAQKIKYEKSLNEAKRISKEQNKPLAILVTVEPPPSVTNFMAGLTDKDVVNKFNEHFINFRIDRADTASKSIISEYRITGFPSLVFVDSKGGLLFKDFGSSSIPQRYLDMADRAINAVKDGSLIDLDNQYKSGNYNAAFLKDYITRRQKAGITNNADLIEKYVTFLTVSDLDNYNQVLFIMKAGPLVDSKAYKLAHVNRKIIDSIYKTEPPEVRSAINNGIVTNTLADAVATKNIAKATAAANFSRSTWTKDPIEGQKNYTLRMLYYYKTIKDTTNYLRQAGSFYDQYYMNVSADSIKKMDQKNMEKAKDYALQRAMTNVPQGVSLQSFSFTYAAPNYATQLNNAAYSFYQTGTKTRSYLTKAMLWSKRSIELSPAISAYHDTLAHLLYQLGFYFEAENTQRKAVELAKDEKRNVKEMEEELEKIEKRKL